MRRKGIMGKTKSDKSAESASSSEHEEVKNNESEITDILADDPPGPINVMNFDHNRIRTGDHKSDKNPYFVFTNVELVYDKISKGKKIPASVDLRFPVVKSFYGISEFKKKDEDEEEEKSRKKKEADKKKPKSLTIGFSLNDHPDVVEKLDLLYEKITEEVFKRKKKIQFQKPVTQKLAQVGTLAEFRKLIEPIVSKSDNGATLYVKVWNNSNFGTVTKTPLKHDDLMGVIIEGIPTISIRTIRFATGNAGWKFQPSLSVMTVLNVQQRDNFHLHDDINAQLIQDNPDLAKGMVEDQISKIRSAISGELGNLQIEVKKPKKGKKVSSSSDDSSSSSEEYVKTKSKKPAPKGKKIVKKKKSSSESEESSEEKKPKKVVKRKSSNESSEDKKPKKGGKKPAKKDESSSDNEEIDTSDAPKRKPDETYE